MPDRMSTSLRITSFLVVLSGYLALATTYRYSAAVIAIPLALLALMPLGEWMDRRFVKYRMATSFISVAFVAVSLALLPFMDLLANVVNLIIFIECYTLLHCKNPKSYLHLLLMSFFLVLAASVLMPDPEIGVVLLLFMVGSIALMALLQIHMQDLTTAGSAVIDIVPLDEQEMSLAEPRKGLDFGLVNSISATSVAAIFLTGLLFVTMPRMEAGLLGRNDPTLFRMGVSQTVDLAQGGRIAHTSAALMRVEFPDEPGGRYNGPMFWRCSTMDDYREPQWQRKGLVNNDKLANYCVDSRVILDVASRKGGQVMRPHDAKRRLVRQRIYIQDAPADGVPALTLAQQMKVPDVEPGVFLAWDRSADYSIALSKRGQRWLQYEAVSEVEEFTPEQLRAAADNYQEALTPQNEGRGPANPSNNYRLLTYQTLQPRSVELVQQITRGKTNTYDKVTAIAAYLSQGAFTYTTDVPQLPQRQPIDAFLHEVKTGHCEIFASAMALMVRSLGIPARVVAGFRGGDWSELDKAYIVREDMAHLWVEVYFIGLGWATFDPSPPDAQRTFARNPLMRFLSRQALVAKMLWYRNIVAFNTDSQLSTLRNLQLGFISLREGLFDWRPERASKFQPGPAFALLLMFPVACGLIASAFVGWARATGPQRYPLTPDQARAVKLYKRALRRLERAGVKCRNLTVEEMQAAFSVQATALNARVDGGAVHEVLSVYNRVRFGGRPLDTSTYKTLRNRL